MTQRFTALLTVLLTSATLAPTAYSESFRDFLKQDKKAFDTYRDNRSVATPQPDNAPAPIQYYKEAATDSQRERVMTIYSSYCRLRKAIEDEDPTKGLRKRIEALRARLFPTNRPWVDCLSLWSRREWDVDWPLLQDLEKRKLEVEARTRQLEQEWRDAGFSRLFGLPLEDCYGRKTWYSYLDTADQSVFPSPIRSNRVDYVVSQLNRLWPTNAIETASQSKPEPPSNREPVIHKDPPPPEPEEPELPPIDETIRPENIEPLIPWDQMTPEQRRRALMENRPEAWDGFARDIFGTDTNAQARARTTVTCTNVTAVSTNIAIANLPPPTPVAPANGWDQMTPEQRHEALKQNRTDAWDGLRDALLSGDPQRLEEVLAALTPQPQINDVARATAYFHGYQLGQMETATGAKESTLDTVAAAYLHPELISLVRAGYADAKAGRSPRYSLPGPDALQQFMPPNTTP